MIRLLPIMLCLSAIHVIRAAERFEDVTQQVGLDGLSGDVAAWVDFDQDGWCDLYVAGQLWRNEQGQRFRRVADVPLSGAGLWGDFNNDGHLDLLVGNFSHPPAYQDRPMFLRNRGPEAAFRFEDRSSTARLRWQESYASPALADFDNDGRLDLFFTTVYSGDKSVLYRNQGNWKFEEVSQAAKVDVPTTYQAAWGDFDHDGDPDLVTGGRLFRNPAGGNHWLKVRLIGGGKVNASAIGAQVRIRLGDNTLTRQVESASGQGNQNDGTLHFGLHEHTDPLRLRIRWPDGTRQEIDARVDRLTTVRHQTKEQADD